MDAGPLSAPPPLPDRQRWRKARREKENAHLNRPFSLKRTLLHGVILLVHALLLGLMKLTGLFQRGVRNALNIQTRRLELSFPHLPQAFDGLTILQLSDMHLDEFDALAEELSRTIAHAVSVEKADILVITGDTQGRHRPTVSPLLLKLLAPILEAAETPEGGCAILGNHDEHYLAESMEEMGLRVLINETITLRRGGSEIFITGLDDIHLFPSAAAKAALREAPAGFRIALIHSPEYAEEAWEAGCALYLCGHTHHGQIALPGGRALFTGLKKNRHLFAGLWRWEGLQGYTSPGAGVNGIPVRFFTQPEITLITLRRSTDPA